MTHRSQILKPAQSLRQSKFDCRVLVHVVSYLKRSVVTVTKMTVEVSDSRLARPAGQLAAVVGRALAVQVATVLVLAEQVLN